jgi:hypothetical protein
MSKDIKTCAICHLKIDDKDNYYLLQSYRLGTYLGKKYYHWKCFNDKIKGDEDMEYMKRHAIKLLDKTNKMVEAQVNGHD